MRSPAQQHALDRLATWRERYESRLAQFHPDVRAEVESTARDRFIAGNFERLSDEDLRRCAMRVASRKRLMMGTPAGADGSGEQLHEIVDTLNAW